MVNDAVPEELPQRIDPGLSNAVCGLRRGRRGPPESVTRWITFRSSDRGRDAAAWGRGRPTS
jgi:hypothetical protein